MIKVGRVQILCGAWDADAAHEALEEGVFTKALLAALAQQHDPPLLDLPLDLDAWKRRLPADLLAQSGAVILENSRDVVITGRPTRRGKRERQRVKR